MFSSGLCLAVKNIGLSEMIVTSSCLDESYFRSWSSKNYLDDGSSFFLKIPQTDFFIDFGAAYTEKMFLHDAKSLNPEVDDVHWY